METPPQNLGVSTPSPSGLTPDTECGSFALLYTGFFWFTVLLCLIIELISPRYA